MVELLRFSLKRRLLNKTTMIWNFCILLLMGALFFGDVLIDALFPTYFQVYDLYVEDESFYHYLQAQAHPQFNLYGGQQEVADKIAVLDEEMVLHYKYKEDIVLTSILQTYLNDYEKQQMYDELQLDSFTKLRLQTPYQVSVEIKDSLQSEEGILSFMLITLIYFFLLSFATMVANEIVYEKATKTLELILTSIDAKEHLHAKILTGWIMMMAQGGILCLSFLWWYLIRFIYDRGTGLCLLIQKLGIFYFPVDNFPMLQEVLFEQRHLIPNFLLALVILFIGMLFVQLLLVFVSSFVSSLEEASSLQAPFYSLLLGIYYVTIFMNDPYSLTYGLGYYLSFVPLFNMLLMPARIMLGNVPLWNLLCSCFLSVVTFIYVYQKGVPIYRIGVLDYANQGMFHALRRKKTKSS